MLCDKCQKNEATVHMTKILNDKKTEKHLCASCAEKEKTLKYSASMGNSFFDALQNDFFKNMIYPDYGSLAFEEEKCPHCGMTYSEFNGLGKFGCAHCYEAFQNRLDPLIKRLQASTTYEGHIPKRNHANLKKQADIKALRKALTEAIKAEDFEKAVTLRDKIKQLEADQAK